LTSNAIIRRRVFEAQRGDRFQELTTMADGGDAETLEVILCQIGQQFASDVILAECRLVSFKAKCSKPFRDVHRRSCPSRTAGKACDSASRDLSSGNLWPRVQPVKRFIGMAHRPR
jgi:hypothetical protein